MFVIKEIVCTQKNNIIAIKNIFVDCMYSVHILTTLINCKMFFEILLNKCRFLPKKKSFEIYNKYRFLKSNASIIGITNYTMVL